MPLKIELVYKEDSWQRVSLHLNVLIKRLMTLVVLMSYFLATDAKTELKGFRSSRICSCQALAIFVLSSKKRNMIVERRTIILAA